MAEQMCDAVADSDFECQSEDNETMIPSTSTSVTNEIEAWKRFNSWVHCICVVTFDLELGQALEVRKLIHIA
jgi:hypothetical protein